MRILERFTNFSSIDIISYDIKQKETSQDYNNLGCIDGSRHRHINFTDAVKACSKISSYANITTPYWTGKRYIGKNISYNRKYFSRF